MSENCQQGLSKMALAVVSSSSSSSSTSQTKTGFSCLMLTILKRSLPIVSMPVPKIVRSQLSLVDILKPCSSMNTIAEIQGKPVCHTHAAIR